MKKNALLTLLFSLNGCSSFTTNFDCKDPKNIGLIGQSGECKDKLIVDNKLLFDLVEKNKDYSHTKIYTFHVTDMSNLFQYKEVKYDITGWDVSNVTSMYSMFKNADNFNQPLDKWNVSNVTNMSAMFLNANYFNQPLNDWNVSNVTNMSKMFSGNGNFNQPLDKWDVSNVTDMQEMFSTTYFFNQPLNNWNVSNVKNMSKMFLLTSNFNQPLNQWNISNVKNMKSMFFNAHYFKQKLDLNKWIGIYDDNYWTCGTK